VLKYSIVTLGCKVNQYEEKQIAASFERSGFIPAGEDESPDVFTVNSCAVTSEAESKSRQAAGRARKKYPEAVVVLTGCYATRMGDEKLESVDVYVGQDLKGKTCEVMLGVLEAAQGESKRFSRLLQMRREEECMKRPRTADGTAGKPAGRARAQVKIQDGCANFCTYCVVPFIRNREWSRPAEEVLAEIDSLVRSGYKEVVLTGIHLGRYSSLDIANREVAFEDLLKMIDLYDFSDKIRIRLSSIDPYDISEKIVAIIKNSEIFVPHLHIPLQSGSDAILKAMNRKYSRTQYREKVGMIFAALERPAITTDVIVGFPGETQADFEDTYNLLNEFNFYDFHIFQYSQRPGTEAAGFSGKVPAQEKKKRSQSLHDLKKLKNASFYKANIGTIARVIPEKIAGGGNNAETLLIGHSERYIESRFAGDPETLGKIVEVRLTSIADDFDGMCAQLPV